MSDQMLPNRFLQHFIATVTSELGQDILASVLEKAGLPPEQADPAYWGTLNGTSAAGTYAGVQKAMRTYFGRGARGILIRIGGSLWKRLLDDASLAVKAKSKLILGLPLKARRKPALELLAGLLAGRRGDVTVHTLDLDLLLVDKTSPTALGQSGAERICYVTLGLVRECLYWATGEEHDIEETSCRANGAEACEFKITIEK